MRIPFWLALFVGSVVVIWGAYRCSIFFRGQAEQARAQSRGGLFGQARSTHLLIGIVNMILGGMLIASAFGYSPLAGLLGSSKGAAKPSGPTPVTVESK